MRSVPLCGRAMMHAITRQGMRQRYGGEVLKSLQMLLAYRDAVSYGPPEVPISVCLGPNISVTCIIPASGASCEDRCPAASSSYKRRKLYPVKTLDTSKYSSVPMEAKAFQSYHPAANIQMQFKIWRWISMRLEASSAGLHICLRI